MTSPIPQIKEKLAERLPLINVTEDGLGPWSVSMMKQLNKCPLQFFLEKGLKVKHTREAGEDNNVTQVGKAAHVWVENIVLGDSVEAGLEKAKEQHYKDVTEKYWERVTNLTGTMYSFQQRMDSFKANNKIKRIYPELKIGLDKDFKKTGFFDKNVFFRGVIDLPISLANGDVIIIDHKFGGSGKFGMRNYKKQLDTYKVMYHFGVHSIRGAQTGIHFMAEGEMMMGDYTSAAEIEDVLLRELRHDLRDTVTNIQDAKVFAHKRGTQCNYCAFREQCENGKRGTAGELQFVVEESKQVFK